MTDSTISTVWQPVLQDTWLRLEPLQASHFDTLFGVASDPEMWIQHPASDRYQRPVFERFFTEALASRGALLAIDRTDAHIIGCSRYYDWNPQQRTVAIGFTFLARSHWGGLWNRRMKRLMLAHAFQHVETVFFHVGPNNIRSRRALEKIGARHIPEKAEPGREWYRLEKNHSPIVLE